MKLTQIGKFINIYIGEDVYQEFREKYLLEKLKESDLKGIREFIYDMGKNETGVRDDLVRCAVEKLAEIDLTSKLEKSNLNEVRLLIHNINKAGYDPQFVIEILKKVNLIPKIEKSSLNDINMLIYNINQVGGDQYG